MTSLFTANLINNLLLSSVLVLLGNWNFLVDDVIILWLFLVIIVDIDCPFTFRNVWFFLLYFAFWHELVLFYRLNTWRFSWWAWRLRLDSFEKSSVVIVVLILVTRAIVVPWTLRTWLNEAKSGGFSFFWLITLFDFLFVIVLVGLAVSPSA